MINRTDLPHLPALLRPLADASAALGHLACALETTRLHHAWLWRETARVAAKISQFSGHRVQIGRLVQALAGVPLEPAEDDAGLAAARRVFLTAVPLFQASSSVESTDVHRELFQPLWPLDRGCGPEDGNGQDTACSDRNRPGVGDDKAADGVAAEDELRLFVHDLTDMAGLDSRPALLDLFLELRRHPATRRLPIGLARLALPLALHQAGVVPKAVPALIGGRLPLRAGWSPAEEDAITPWLARGLAALAEEAADAGRRLGELVERHRSWHACLAEVGLRCHARSPVVLDLLAATPVLSASLVARHLGCTSQGAGAMLRRLAELGIVSEATSRARWKIYVAGDLKPPAVGEGEGECPLVPSAPAPEFDHDALEATLDGLFADLERLNLRTRKTLAAPQNQRCHPGRR